MTKTHAPRLLVHRAPAVRRHRRCPVGRRAARAAQDEGRFIEAARLAEEVGTSAGLALGRGVAGDPWLLQSPRNRRRRGCSSVPCGSRKRPSGLTRRIPRHHLQSAHAMGRYAQTIGAVKAIAQGYAGKVRRAIEDALALDPEMAGAHLSLATWHSETINGAGLAARVVFGASRKARPSPTMSGPWSLHPTRSSRTSSTRSDCCS